MIPWTFCPRPPIPLVAHPPSLSCSAPISTTPIASVADEVELVQVILYDGRVIVVCPVHRSLTTRDLAHAPLQGKLRGCDLRTNIILSECVEREYSSEQGVEMIPLGLYMIKGDNVYVALCLPVLVHILPLFQLYG